MALVGVIFKFKLSGQNLRGYGGDREHVAANNSLKTILPLPHFGQILGSMPVTRSNRSSQDSFSVRSWSGFDSTPRNCRHRASLCAA